MRLLFMPCVLILNYRLRVLNETCHLKKLYRGCLLSASVLTWFIRYIYYRNLQFLNIVIINEKNQGSPPSDIGDLSRFWLSC